MPENPPARIHRLLAAGISLAASAVLLLGSAAPASAAGDAYDTLTITAEPAAVDVGDVVTVTAVATGTVDAYAYELALGYDTALLAYADGSDALPSGGFGSVADEGAEVSVVATRLGTSPGLTGTQTLVTFRFIAKAAGVAGIGLTSGRIVDSAGAVSDIDITGEGATARVTITAPAGPGTNPGSPSSNPGNPGSGNGAGAGTGAGGQSAPPSDGADLPSTGGDAVPWLIAGAFAVAAIVAGSVMIVVRRRTR
ncbi:LPXTG-motif cell wall-anchored protein [Microbacterium resistens]|uniref:LPXTG-motif cell wall-anchored protein n=1 Tax=Microbacterium resistens TaxID=156977 RepID=A0ABU1S9T6_9MICO|nr:cohesin domain-containing protein [Microbacterium resistens]MDR6865582.1 LPXTG-motif cell wall-anchored protein [Microbacterium resistens]